MQHEPFKVLEYTIEKKGPLCFPVWILMKLFLSLAVYISWKWREQKRQYVSEPNYILPDYLDYMTSFTYTSSLHCAMTILLRM